MMRVEKLKAPRLTTTKMVCDDPIDKKLLKYPATECNFSNNFFMVICGGQGSGKTSTTISFLKSCFNRCFEDVFLIMPSISVASIAPEDNVFAELPEENVFDEFNEDAMTEIEKKTKENSLQGEHSLLIIDDFGSVFSNEKLMENKILRRMCIKTRHHKCSIILLLQNLYQLPKKLREVCSSIMFFNLGKSQNEKLIREFLPYTEEQIQEIMSMFKDEHDWLIFNVKKRRIFYKLEKELVFDDA
jgi:hypothetical protein